MKKLYKIAFKQIETLKVIIVYYSGSVDRKKEKNKVVKPVPYESTWH